MSKKKTLTDTLLALRENSKYMITEFKKEYPDMNIGSEKPNEKEIVVKMIADLTEGLTNTFLLFDERQAKIEKELIEKTQLINSQEAKIQQLDSEKGNYDIQIETMSNRIKRITEEYNVIEKELETIKNKAQEIDKIEEMFNQLDLDKDIENNASASITNKPPSVKMKAPIFKGDHGEKPLKFLVDLQKYFENYSDKKGENTKILISQCLQKGAKNWFYLVEKDINSFDSFVDLFKKRYWNITIKDGLRRIFNSGAYSIKGKQTRVQYALKLFNIAEDLEISNDQEEIINQIIPHFDPDIRRIIRSLRTKTRDEFLDILEQADNDDRSIRNRQEPNWQNKKPYSNDNSYRNNNSYSYNNQSNNDKEQS